MSSTNLPADLADFAASGLPASMLDAMPILTLLVDSDVKILWLNRFAREHLAATIEQVRDRRGGDVLHCLHSTETPGGCGRSPFCKDCLVRNSVGRAIAGSKPWRVRTTLRVATPTGLADLHMLVTAVPVDNEGGRLVMLMLEDITELLRLRGLIPVCAWCRKVRTDETYKKSLEQYLEDTLNIRLTHGICPECQLKWEADGLPEAAATDPVAGDQTPPAADERP